MPPTAASLPFRTEGRFTVAHHAKERVATRGLRADAIYAALALGLSVYLRGAGIYAIGREEIDRYAEERVGLSTYDGVQVVVTPRAPSSPRIATAPSGAFVTATAIGGALSPSRRNPHRYTNWRR